jgi:hypothetical protein
LVTFTSLAGFFGLTKGTLLITEMPRVRWLASLFSNVAVQVADPPVCTRVGVQLLVTDMPFVWLWAAAGRGATNDDVTPRAVNRSPTIARRRVATNLKTFIANLLVGLVRTYCCVTPWTACACKVLSCAFHEQAARPRGSRTINPAKPRRPAPQDRAGQISSGYPIQARLMRKRPAAG